MHMVKTQVCSFDLPDFIAICLQIAWYSLIKGDSGGGMVIVIIHICYWTPNYSLPNKQGGIKNGFLA